MQLFSVNTIKENKLGDHGPKPKASVIFYSAFLSLSLILCWAVQYLFTVMYQSVSQEIVISNKNIDIIG